MNKRAGKTAADIVNEYDEGALADIFYLYGEPVSYTHLSYLFIGIPPPAEQDAGFPFAGQHLRSQPPHPQSGGGECGRCV